MEKVLSREQIDEFIRTGCCVLRGAYSRSVAEALAERIRSDIETKTEIRMADSASWPDGYYLSPTVLDEVGLACLTPRLKGAVTELMGSCNWETARWNFPVNFPYLGGSTDEFPLRGWHIDGKWEGETFLGCPFGLVVLGLLTDVERSFGGTVFALGSHASSARRIADPNTNLWRPDLFRALLSDPIGDFIEFTGVAGDVALAHPFLLHATGFNRKGPPRPINAIRFRPASPLRLEGPDEELTPFEVSVRRALHEPPRSPSNARLCQPMAD